MQCRTSGNGDLPLHPLSKGFGFGLLGEHRGASVKRNVARTTCVLCGQRRERKTAFAKVLPKLWIVTCDRDGSIARGNYHQGGNARRQVVAKTQLPHLDQVGATLCTNSVRCDGLSKGKDLKRLVPKADRVPVKAVSMPLENQANLLKNKKLSALVRGRSTVQSCAAAPASQFPLWAESTRCARRSCVPAPSASRSRARRMKQI